MPRGGFRPGSGRKRGQASPTTRDHKRTISEMAREHAPDALKALVEIARSGVSESARVSAASAVLDRGFGKPKQAHEHTGADGGPIQTVDLANLNDDQLAALEAVFGPLAAAGDDDAAYPGREGETAH